jgi:hypothetical protein
VHAGDPLGKILTCGAGSNSSPIEHWPVATPHAEEVIPTEL